MTPQPENPWLAFLDGKLWAAGTLFALVAVAVLFIGQILAWAAGGGE